MLVLEGLVGLHRTVKLQLLSVTGWGIDLDYCDIEWFALEMNRDHCVIFEIASKYCISESCIIKKAEHQRTDAFELWCWRRLLRIPWTAKR